MKLKRNEMVQAVQGRTVREMVMNDLYCDQGINTGEAIYDLISIGATVVLHGWTYTLLKNPPKDGIPRFRKSGTEPA